MRKNKAPRTGKLVSVHDFYLINYLKQIFKLYFLEKDLSITGPVSVSPQLVFSAHCWSWHAVVGRTRRQFEPPRPAPQWFRSYLTGYVFMVAEVITIPGKTADCTHLYPVCQKTSFLSLSDLIPRCCVWGRCEFACAGGQTITSHQQVIFTDEVLPSVWKCANQSCSVILAFLSVLSTWLSIQVTFLGHKTRLISIDDTPTAIWWVGSIEELDELPWWI